MGNVLRSTGVITGVFPGGKDGRCVRLTTLPPSCAVVMKSGNLNFLETSGPLRVCNGTALPLYIYMFVCVCVCVYVCVCIYMCVYIYIYVCVCVYTGCPGRNVKKLRERVPYVKIYRYNPKHLYPKLNGYGDNGQRKVWTSGRSTNCTCQLTV
jgi:hypothetical protein